MARPPGPFIEAELADLPPGRALELAAGAGRHTVWLAERGRRVTAVGFSRVGLALNRQCDAARAVDESQLDWIVADLGGHEPERGAYDLALISYLQASWAVRARILAQAAAALAPGGPAFVLGDDLANLTEGRGRPRDPEVLYTPGAVAAKLPGLRIIRAGRAYSAAEVNGSPATAISTLVRAVRAD